MFSTVIAPSADFTVPTLFFKRGPTTTNLLELTYIVINGCNIKLQTDVLHTDLIKVFEFLNHSLLVFKLDLLRFSKKLSTWISSYLNGRTQRVIFQKNT